jgi:hypothetical protein
MSKEDHHQENEVKFRVRSWQQLVYETLTGSARTNTTNEETTQTSQGASDVCMYLMRTEKESDEAMAVGADELKATDASKWKLS